LSAYQNRGGLALAAYNAGQANVDRWIADTPAGGTVKIPFPETRDYVADVERVQALYRQAYHGELYGETLTRSAARRFAATSRSSAACGCAPSSARSSAQCR